MKLDFNQFPAIKNLSADVREKALEYAETLGARGPRPTTVLGTAVTLAQEWKSGRLPARPVAAPYLVQPKNGRWIIKRSSSELASHVYMRKDDAVRRAQELAKQDGAACFVFGPGGTLIERYEARAIAAMEFPRVEVEVAAAAVEPQVEAQTIELTPVESRVEPVIELTPVESRVEAAPVEPVVEVAPVESVVEVAPVEPVVEVAPVEALEIDISEEPIRVRRVANKWLVVLGDGRSEALATKAKAVKRAQELGRQLGRPIVA